MRGMIELPKLSIDDLFISWSDGLKSSLDVLSSKPDTVIEDLLFESDMSLLDFKKQLKSSLDSGQITETEYQEAVYGAEMGINLFHESYKNKNVKVKK